MSMKRNSFLICILAVLLLFSCGEGARLPLLCPTVTPFPLRYAENLTLVSYPDYTLATLRNPWDTLHTLHTYILVPKDRELPAHLPEGTVVRTPLSKSVIYSSVHCGLMDNLGVFSSIGGVCDLKYIKLPAVHEALPSGYHCRLRRWYESRYGTYHRPASRCHSSISVREQWWLWPYRETGYSHHRMCRLYGNFRFGPCRMDVFYGLLFGAAPQADSLFAEVDSCYRRLKMRAKLSSTSLSIVSEMKSGSAWYAPGGRSTIGRLFRMLAGVTLLPTIPTAVLFLWLSRPFSTRRAMPTSGW